MALPSSYNPAEWAQVSPDFFVSKYKGLNRSQFYHGGAQQGLGSIFGLTRGIV